MGARISAVATVLLALGLSATPSLAGRGGNTPVRGVVIGVSSDKIEIQSATGAVTVAITEKTRVIRTVSGTVADLRRGLIVEVVRNADSGRVIRLHIAPAGTKLGEVPPGWGQGRGQVRNRMAQIRAVSPKTIRVRYVNSRIVTYRLAKRPTVIKDLFGRISDIAVGQTVLVTRTHGGRLADAIVLLRG